MDFYIACSDNCLYQEDGICVLTQITSSGGEDFGSCPYFRKINRDYSENTSSWDGLIQK